MSVDDDGQARVPTTIPRKKREKLVRRAKMRALNEMKKMHPEEYRRIINRERRALGIEPIGTVRPGRSPINEKSGR